LLLGVITTLLIAWGCAKWIDLQGTGRVFIHAAPNAAPSCLIQQWSRGGIGSGAWCVESIPIGDPVVFFARSPDLVWNGSLTQEFMAGVEQARWEVLPPFGLHAQQLSGNNVIHRCDARGWPLAAIRRTITIDAANDNSALADAIAAYETAYARATTGAWTVRVVPQPMEVRPSPKRLLSMDAPWRPHWPGLLMNSAIFALVWWVLAVAFKLLWFIPSTLARRRQVMLAAATPVLGIGTTITICWLIALFHDMPKQPRLVTWFNRSVSSMVTWRDPSLIPATDNRRMWVPQTRTISVAATQPETPIGLTSFMAATQTDAVSPPGWHLRQFHAVGWPMLAMWSGRSQDIPLGQSITPIQTVNGIELGASIRRRLATSTYRALPTGILWPGFIVNSVAASTAWLLLICCCIATYRGRGWWRVRRHECPKCGYPIGTSLQCTECGRELPAILQQIVRQGPAAR